jgi:hypothetical protein
MMLIPFQCSFLLFKVTHRTRKFDAPSVYTLFYLFELQLHSVIVRHERMLAYFLTNVYVGSRGKTTWWKFSKRHLDSNFWYYLKQNHKIFWYRFHQQIFKDSKLLHKMLLVEKSQVVFPLVGRIRKIYDFFVFLIKPEFNWIQCRFFKWSDKNRNSWKLCIFVIWNHQLEI